MKLDSSVRCHIYTNAPDSHTHIHTYTDNQEVETVCDVGSFG
jgi:hypothetical protein